MASLLCNLKTPLHFHSFKTPFSFRLIPSLSYRSNNPRLFHSPISSLKAAAAASDSASDKLVDWEDPILQDAVPLVGVVRMILHSGLYKNGQKLSPEHEKMVLEKLLPYHPEYQKKIGTGVDYITIGYHPDFDRTTRCMFIVRKDGKMVDFSYWKCIKGLVKNNADKISRPIFQQ